MSGRLPQEGRVMDEVFLIDDTKVEFAKGRYAVFGDDNQLVAQDNDLDTAMSAARAKGARHPAIVNLDMMREQTYVF